ncbi:MAG: TlpA disulfide reductase family protein [Melioribacteraceae bacterium]|jgi:thiol-disulfide isomerase/thioredoxin|nr:TlpA disulfide reductase family protein [Melioribacteraceae bacterium]
MKDFFSAVIILLLAINILASADEKSKQNNKTIVELIDKEKLTKLIKERKGKPLFLNLWATWCVPCREEFPSINKLAEELKDVEFIGISVDFPEEVDSKIIPFLKSQNAKFVSFVNGFEGDEELINTLDKNWNGALPATFIYDKAGKKISFLEGKKSYDEFKKEIEKARKK